MAMQQAGGDGIRLRPLEIGDVLDETFRVYKRRFVPLITVMALVVVPSSLLSLLVVLATGISETSLARNISTEASIAAMVVLIGLSFVAGLAQIVAAGASVLVASDAVLGRPTSIGEAYRQAFGRFGSLLLAGFLAFLPVALLIMTCVGIPVAIFVGLGWALVFQAILLEGHGAVAAMRRSWDLVSGHRWRLLACVVLIGLITALLVSIPTALFAFGAGILVALTGASPAALMLTQVGNTVFQALGQTLFGTIGYVTATLLYYDLRIRKEAFDLQQQLPGYDLSQYQGYQGSVQYPYPPENPDYSQQSQYPPQQSRYPPLPPRIPPPPNP